jgi:hypothetical protein
VLTAGAELLLLVIESQPPIQPPAVPSRKARRSFGLDTASYPKVEGSAPHLSLIYPSKSLALLVVWTFLAGFSERLVPSLLQDTETSIAKKTASK